MPQYGTFQYGSTRYGEAGASRGATVQQGYGAAVYGDSRYGAHGLLNMGAIVSAANPNVPAIARLPASFRQRAPIAASATPVAIVRPAGDRTPLRFVLYTGMAGLPRVNLTTATVFLRLRRHGSNRYVYTNRDDQRCLTLDRANGVVEYHWPAAPSKGTYAGSLLITDLAYPSRHGPSFTVTFQ